MELKGVLDSGDLGEIKAKTDALVEASHKLAEAVYARRAPSRPPRRRRRRGRAREDEVVEDADYEVVDEGKS